MNEEFAMWAKAVKADVDSKGAKIIGTTALPGGGFCVVAKGGAVENHLDCTEMKKSLIKSSVQLGKPVEHLLTDKTETFEEVAKIDLQTLPVE